MWSIIGWVGTLLMPALHGTPVVLMLLAPRALFVALAADSIGILLFVLLGTLRLSATDASYFILGRRFAHVPKRAVERPPTARRGVRSALVRVTDALCRWVCNHGVKAGAVLFVRPNGKYLAVAGAYGVSARIAGWSSVLGTALYLACVHIGIGLIF